MVANLPASILSQAGKTVTLNRINQTGPDSTDFGAIRNGLAATQTELNEQLDYYAGRPNELCIIRRGVYLLNSPLLLSGRITVYCEPGVVFVRNFSGGGEVNATLRTKNLAANYDNVKWYGGKFRSANDTKTGKHVSLCRIDNFLIEGTRWAEVYGDWQTSFVDNTNATYRGLMMHGGATNSEDGLHLLGGENVLVEYCWVAVGDDSFSGAMEGSSGEVVPLKNVTIRMCGFISWAANALRLMTTTAQTISDITIEDIYAVSGDGTGTTSAGISILGNSSAKVENVSIKRFYIDCSRNKLYGMKADYFDGIDIETMIIDSPYQRAVWIPRGDNFKARDMEWTAPRAASTQGALIGELGNCSDIRFTEGHFAADTHDVFEFGNGSHVVNGFEVSNSIVRGRDLRGIRLQNAINGKVTKNTIYGCASYGVQEISPCDYNRIVGNDLENNGDTVVTSGANTVATGNY